MTLHYIFFFDFIAGAKVLYIVDCLETGGRNWSDALGALLAESWFFNVGSFVKIKAYNKSQSLQGFPFKFFCLCHWAANFDSDLAYSDIWLNSFAPVTWLEIFDMMSSHLMSLHFIDYASSSETLLNPENCESKVVEVVS